jgi:hypothetical protein
MKYTVEMASCDTIYIQRFMETGTFFQVMLNFASN